MKKMNSTIFPKVIALLMVALLGSMSVVCAQNTIATNTTFTNNNGNGTVTFNFQNTNPYPIVITDISGVVGAAGNNTASIYYNTTPVSAQPIAINAANGWALVASGPFIGIANTSGTNNAIQPFLSNIAFTIPANTTYGIAIHATNQRFSNITSAQTFSSGGCSLLTGPGIGFGGGNPPLPPTFSSKGWIGSITFQPVPQTPNNARVSVLTEPLSYCAGGQNIKVKVKNMGTNIINSFQLGWSLNGVVQAPVSFSNAAIDIFGSIAGDTREVLLANNFTLPLGVQNIKVWPYLPNGVPDTNPNDDTLQATIYSKLSGNYTINPAQPYSASNFQQIDSFARYLNTYGVCGPVVANVAAGSGPYNQLVNFGNIPGVSNVNTVRINGNGATIQYANTTNLNERQLIQLNGAKYLHIDNFVLKALSANVGWGINISAGCRYDSITNCVIDNSLVTSAALDQNNGITFSQTPLSPTTSGDNGKLCYIGNNYIKGSTGVGGMYYGIAIPLGSDSNTVANNTIENFTQFGIWLSGVTGNKVLNNNIHKSTKTTATVAFTGIYFTGTCPGMKIIGNKIHDPIAASATNTQPFYGISAGGGGSVSDSVLIANNSIYNINQQGVIYGLYLSGSSYSNVFHNSVSIDKVVTGTNNNYGIFAQNTNTGLIIKNNLINITGGSLGSKYGFSYGAAASVSPANIQKNNFYLNSTQSGSQYYGFYISAYLTQSAFQTAQPAMEVGSPAFNPQFVNAAAGNLMPGNQSLYGTGWSMLNVIPTDILNAPRNTIPTPGAYEIVSSLTNDAGIVSFASPAGAVCSGLQNVSLKIVNAGANVLNNVQIQWSINNVMQTPVNYSAVIAANTAAPGNTAIVSLGNVNFTTTATVIKAWTTAPNGSADAFHLNDTIQGSYVASMSGTYTINSAVPVSATNYQTLTSFADALATYGVCGPVTANVVAASGPYVETVTFNPVNGTSAANTIKINGNGATVQFANGVSARQMLILNGIKYLTIDSLTFKALNVDYGWGAVIYNSASFDTIKRCTFDLTAVTATTAAQCNGIAFTSNLTSPTSTGTNGNNCYIGYNKVLGSTAAGGPLYAISLAGTNSNNIIDHNYLLNFVNYGVYVSGGSYNTVQNNDITRITKNSTVGFFGIQLTGTIAGLKVIGNKIHDPASALGISNNLFYGIYGNVFNGVASDRCLVANNIIYNANLTGNLFGMNFTGTSFTDIVHNSVSFDQPFTTSSYIYGLWANGTSNTSTFSNNNIAITNGGLGVKYGAYYGATNTFASLSRNNIYINVPQTGTAYYAHLSAEYSTLVSFRSAYPSFEVGSISVNPQYTSPATGNLLPTNYMLLANGINTNAMVPQDFLGVNRINMPTPGAYEMVPSGLNNAAGITLVNPTGTFCNGNQEIRAVIANAGTNDISSVVVNWQINGVQQPVLNYNTVLNPIASNANFMDTVVLGVHNFLPAVPIDVKVWTSKPNNTNDSYTQNDTFQRTLQPAVFDVDALADTLCLGTSTLVTVLPANTIIQGNAVWQGSGDGIVWNNIPNIAGNVINTGLMMTDTFYRVKISNGATTCYSDTVNIKVASPAILSADSVAACGEGPITLNAAVSINSIAKWYDSPTATTPIATGPAFTTPSLTATTIYYVSAGIASGAAVCATPKQIVKAIVKPKPVVDLGGDQNVCTHPGDQFTLDAGVQPNNGTYLWNDNSTNQTLTISQTGIYAVSVTNSYDCETTDSIEYIYRPYPIVDLGNDTTVCKQVVLTLDAGPGNIQYYWNTGQTSQTLDVNNAGTYSVEVTNNEGCITEDTIKVTQEGFLPKINGIIVTNDGGFKYTFTTINPQNITVFDWDFGDGQHSSEPQPTHTYANDGNYTVVLHLSSTCGYSNDTAEAHIVGIHQINVGQDELTIYPNPSRSTATILNKGNLKLEKIEVYTVLGQVIYTAKPTNNQQHAMHLEGLAAGLYTVQIYTDKGTVSRKIEILK